MVAGSGPTFRATAATLFFPSSSFEAHVELLRLRRRDRRAGPLSSTSRRRQRHPGARPAAGRPSPTSASATRGNLTWVEKTGSAAAQVRVAQSATCWPTTPPRPSPTCRAARARADPVDRRSSPARAACWCGASRTATPGPIRSLDRRADRHHVDAPTTLDSGTGTLADDQFSASVRRRRARCVLVSSGCRPCSVRGCLPRPARRWAHGDRRWATSCRPPDAHLADPGDPRFGQRWRQTRSTAWTDGGDDVRFAAVDQRRTHHAL